MANLLPIERSNKMIKKIIKTAQTFIAENQLDRKYACRFDVALVLKNDNNFSIEYIENAFTKPEEEFDNYYNEILENENLSTANFCKILGTTEC